MFTTSPDTTHDAALIDQAKAEASRLRREAIEQFGNEALDDFWRGAHAVWRRSLQFGHGLAQHGSARLRARMQGRQTIRSASPDELQNGA